VLIESTSKITYQIYLGVFTSFGLQFYQMK